MAMPLFTGVDQVSGEINLNPDTLIAAGRSMKSAGAGAGKANPHGDLGPVADALAGSQSAAAAAALAKAWDQRFKAWTHEADKCGDGMIHLARMYRKADEESQHHGGKLQDSLARGSHLPSLSSAENLRRRLG